MHSGLNIPHNSETQNISSLIPLPKTVAILRASPHDLNWRTFTTTIALSLVNSSTLFLLSSEPQNQHEPNLRMAQSHLRLIAGSGGWGERDPPPSHFRITLAHPVRVRGPALGSPLQMSIGLEQKSKNDWPRPFLVCLCLLHISSSSSSKTSWGAS